MQGLGSDQSQRALTAPEELNGGVTSAITIFHITGIIPQVFLLYGANSQGNCHFLLTEVLLEDPARPTKQEWITTEASDVRLSLLSGTSVDECVSVYMWKHTRPCWTDGSVTVHGWTSWRTLHAINICIFYSAQKTYCRTNNKTIQAALSVTQQWYCGVEMLAIRRKSFYSGCHGNREMERK